MKKKINPLLFAIALALFFLVAYSFKQIKKEKKIIFSEKAPKPIGPYSQAIMVGNTLFVSGMVGINDKGVLDTSDIKTETKLALNNILEILKAAGMNENQVVKATVYLKDIRNFAAMNEVYGSVFTKDPPARETVEIKNLPKGARIEISVVAVGM
ncbi:MAG: RidA family protein [Bacteroidia bacterium]|nr:RidA family protein [Bacteroidia bacterium]